MSQTCGNVVLHLIFSTKKRQPLITTEIGADLYAYLGGIVRQMRGTEIARVIKTNSSRFTKSGASNSRGKLDMVYLG
jgi:REP element-mobilizing transposase RayT